MRWWVSLIVSFEKDNIIVDKFNIIILTNFLK